MNRIEARINYGSFSAPISPCIKSRNIQSGIKIHGHSNKSGKME